eukprot:3367776-Prymnesium_polylepis.1
MARDPGPAHHPRPATFQELQPVHDELVAQMRAVHRWGQQLYLHTAGASLSPHSRVFGRVCSPLGTRESR